MNDGVRYAPVREWRKEVRAPFYGSAAYWLCAILVTAAAVCLSNLPAGVWETRMFAAILLYLAITFAIWLWYFIAVWMVSRVMEENFAIRSNGRVVIKRKKRRNFYVWGVLLAYIVFPAVTLLYIEDRIYKPRMSRFTDILANPVAVGISYVCMFVLVPLAVWSFPQWRGRLELSSRRIKYVVGKYDAVDVGWEEIESVKVTDEPFKILLVLNLTKPHEIQRNFVLTPCAGLSEFNIKGMDVEPNAIIRIIRECVENPAARAILDTPQGVDAVTYGPKWRDIRKFKRAELESSVTG